MYFESRAQAGVLLARQLEKYRYENTVVVALNEGALQVGMEIAAELHATLTIMLSEQVDVPGEGQVFGTVNQDGDFIYNSNFSTGEAEEYYSEFHGYLEDQKREKSNAINRLLGATGIVDGSVLREHNVILVSDGLVDGTSLDAAVEYLKPFRALRVIVAAPVSSVSGVDKAHLVADELHILSVTDNYFDTNHYYEVNNVPSREKALRHLKDFVLCWR